jgi:hypothetical protein
VTEDIEWGNETLKLSIGSVGVGGQPVEVFLKGYKVGSDQDELLDDAMIVLSKALQMGMSPAQMSRDRTFGRSIVKLIVDKLAAAWPPQ